MTVLLTHMAPDPTEADENQVVPQWPARVRARTCDGGEVLAKPALSCRDRWFESISLQRGVSCELGWVPRSTCRCSSSTISPVPSKSNLPVQIAALRRVLGEAPGGDRWIETMPGRGYRFIGPIVTEMEKGAIAAPPQVDTARQPAPTPRADAERRQITAMSCELIGISGRADGVGLEDSREAVGGFQRGRSPRRVRRQPSRACRARPFRLSRCTRIRRRRDARGAGQRSATRCGPYSIIVAWQLSAGVVGFMVIFIVYLAGHTTAACCNCSKIGPTV
jgi:hypothetical protein